MIKNAPVETQILCPSIYRKAAKALFPLESLPELNLGGEVLLK